MTSEVFREQNAIVDRKNTLPVGAGLGDRKISSVSASTASTSGYLSSGASFSSDRKVSVGNPNIIQDKRVTSASSPDRKSSVVSNTKAIANPERPEERIRTSVSSQNNIKSAFEINRKDSQNALGADNFNNLGHNPQVPKKFINTWRQACDKTRERTKDLIRRWRTVPEGSLSLNTPEDESQSVWSHSLEWRNVEAVATLGDPMANSLPEGEWWRCRTYPGCPPPPLIPLSPEQRVKLAQLFNTLLDTDSDSLVSADDFHALAERLREFAGWKESGPQACMLREVVNGLLEAFLLSLHTPDLDTESPCTELRSSISLGLFLGLDDWLTEWSNLLRGAKAMQDLPLWLQYFPKILFSAINKSASGNISKDELRHFYTSFLGFDSRKVDEALVFAYHAMTAGGDHKLTSSTYQLVFANFLLGRHPNGPGQFIFGPFREAGKLSDDVVFPVDYSAMNSLPEDMEEYSPGRKSNRRSVVV